MQDSLFSDLGQILPYLAELQNKIEFLRTLAKSLDDIGESHFIIKYPDGKIVVLGQDIIPFNLGQEIRKLVEDSIDEYQRQHENLNRLFNDTNHWISRDLFMDLFWPLPLVFVGLLQYQEKILIKTGGRR